MATSTFGSGNWNTGTQMGSNYGSVHIYPEQTRPQSPPVPTSTVPFRRDPDFVDRGDILDRLCEKAFVQGSRSALVGLGGVGKSQLAIEYTYRVRDKSPDTWVFWIHASNATRFEQSFREIAKRARINGFDDPSANLLQLVQDWLFDPKNGNWTLVIDNLNDDNFVLQPAKTIWDCLPQNLPGSIVVTSRDRNVPLKVMEHEEIFYVGPMDESHAVTLLEKKLGPHSQRNEAISLATALDFMPLAIAQAASYVRQRAPRFSVQQYLEALDSGGDESSHPLSTYEGFNTRRDREAQNAIFSTLQLSFDHLRQTQRSAAQLLSLMSFFDRQGIPEYVLRGQVEEEYTSDSEVDCLEEEDRVDSSSPQPENTSSNVNAASGDFDDTFENDVLVLTGYSLISIAKDGISFEMHRLVQKAVQEWLRQHEETDRWLEVFLQKLYVSFPNGEFGTWPTCELLFPHVQRLAIQKPGARASLIRWSSIIHRVARYANLQRKFPLAEELVHLSVETRKFHLGPGHPRTISSAMTLASVYYHQEKLKEAEHMIEGIQEIQRRALTLQPDSYPDFTRSSLIASTGALALIYSAQGRQREAERLHTQAVHDHQRILGAEHPSTLWVMQNLATLHVEFDESQFDWEVGPEESEKLLLQVTDTRKRVLGPEHPDTLTAMNDLATVIHRRKDSKKAEDLHKQVIDSRQRVLGSDHPDTIISMSHLSLIYRDQQRWQEAEELGARVFGMYIRVMGPNDPNTLAAMHYHALDLWSVGRVDDAISQMTECLQLSERILGSDNSITEKSLLDLKRWQAKPQSRKRDSLLRLFRRG